MFFSACFTISGFIDSQFYDKLVLRKKFNQKNRKDSFRFLIINCCLWLDVRLNWFKTQTDPLLSAEHGRVRLEQTWIMWTDRRTFVCFWSSITLHLQTFFVQSNCSSYDVICLQSIMITFSVVWTEVNGTVNVKCN